MFHVSFNPARLSPDLGKEGGREKERERLTDWLTDWLTELYCLRIEVKARIPIGQPVLDTNWWWLLTHLRGFWENVPPFIPSLRFLLLLLLFKVEISSSTLIPLCMPGSVHAGSASWDDWGRMFPDKLRVSSLPDRFPHYDGQRHSQSNANYKHLKK